MPKDYTKEYKEAVYIWSGLINGKAYAKLGITGTPKLVRKELDAEEYAKRLHKNAEQRVQEYAGKFLAYKGIYDNEFDVHVVSFYSHEIKNHAVAVEQIAHRNLRSMGFNPVKGTSELYDFEDGAVVEAMFDQITNMAVDDLIMSKSKFNYTSYCDYESLIDAA